jgi:ubiquinone/menaquinone biosynthesis C-methylase UbiE
VRSHESSAAHSGALAYDAIAAGYDAQVQGDDWMRRVLHAHYLRLFKPGDRVLDVGCGTGIDALYLARRGIHVVAIDFAPEMVAQLRAKLDSVKIRDSIETHVLGVADLHQLKGQDFDGLISAFAGLSALDDLSQFSRDAAELVKPGRHLVLHLLNRFSLWEWLGYLARGNWPAARQVGRMRARQFTIGGLAVPHRLYYAEELYQQAFAPRFALRDAYALGALRPPHTVHRLPASLVHELEWLDVRSGRWPLLRHAGRFFVLDLERRRLSA